MAQAKKMMSKVKALRYAEGGDVTSADNKKLGALLYRKRDEEPVSSSAMDLKRMGKQAALLGLGFAPGAGISDYFGTFPAVEGGTEPGAVENFQQGNYGTAALQGLGAMGDIAMGIPVAGAAVGSVMKAPRAIQRGMTASDALKKLPKVSEQGFYSQVEKAILDNPQQKGSGQQFLAQLQKTPGVKAEELQYTGLDNFLTGKPSVTKAEIEDYLDTNRVQVQEVQLGSPSKGQITSQTSNDIREILEAAQVFDDDAASFLERYQRANLSGRRDMQTEASLEEYLRSAGDNRTIDEVAEASRGIAGNTTKFSSYTLPGGENYREVLLTLPEKTPANFPDFDSYFKERYLNSSNGYTTPEAIAYAVRDAMMNWKNSGEQIPMSYTSAGNYTSSHFDQSNILAHMRLNDRVIDGKPTLFVEEIQSDWHQEGRKKGYQGQSKSVTQIDKELDSVVNEIRSMPGVEYAPTEADWARYPEITARHDALVAERAGIDPYKPGVPDAPFKTTWDELTLKRAIKMASDEGYEQIAFTTGKTQADRYDLSKQIDSIEVSTIKGDTRFVKIIPKDKSPNFNLQVNTKDGTVVATMSLSRQFRGKKLDEVVGKDIASKLLGATEPQTLSGVDLSIGGEGMKGFYDKILPKKIEKMGKKYGVKPVLTEMDTPDGKVQVWKFPIPKEMSKTVQEQGQPLFQIGAGAAGLGTAGIMGLSTGEENQGEQ